MARKSMVIKQQKSRSILHANTTDARFAADRMLIFTKFGICRICFRELAYKGQIPGVKKASW